MVQIDSYYTNIEQIKKFRDRKVYEFPPVSVQHKALAAAAVQQLSLSVRTTFRCVVYVPMFTLSYFC